ncbi:hypothetical protein POZ22_23055, partial [Bacteroides uniformis]
ATTGRYTMGALALGAGYMVTCFSHAAMYDSYLKCVAFLGRLLNAYGCNAVTGGQGCRHDG